MRSKVAVRHRWAGEDPLWQPCNARGLSENVQVQCLKPNLGVLRILPSREARIVGERIDIKIVCEKTQGSPQLSEITPADSSAGTSLRTRDSHQQKGRQNGD